MNVLRIGAAAIITMGLATPVVAQDDGIAALAPYHLKLSSTSKLIEYCSEVAAINPEIPFYYYHIPVHTGAYCQMADFLSKASGNIPNLAGVKFTHDDLVDYQMCVDLEGGKYDMLFGTDEIMLASLALGARGCIGSTYNHAAGVYSDIMDAFFKGDHAEARKLQQTMTRSILIIARYGWPAASKKLLKHFGLDLGPVRAPLSDIPDDEFSKMEKELRKAGFFELVKNSGS